MVAAKFIDDDFYSNAFYGKVAGLVPLEVNALEARLISMLRWRLHVQPEQYERYYHEVALAMTERRAAAIQDTPLSCAW